MPLSASPIMAAFERSQALRDRAATQPNGEPSNTIIAPVTADSNHNTTSPLPLPDQNHSKRNIQNVLTLSQRASVIRWMMTESDQAGTKHIASKAVVHFPQLFRGNANANVAKASRLWKARQSFFTSLDSQGRQTLRGLNSTITRRVRGGRKRIDLKAREGRGRKRAAWVDALHRDWREEFDRLRKLGVTFNYRNLQALGLHLLENSTTEEYHPLMLDPRSEKQLKYFVTARFTQAFADRFGIVNRARTGKHKPSPAKIVFLEKQVAHHLGTLARAFRSGDLQEDDVENADETHFVIDMDNGRTLGMSGEQEVKYSDAVSGGEGMTMLVRISGGRDAKIQPPFMVFKNANRSYPIRGVHDDINGVSYRTGPKGWMDTKVMPQWLSERKVMRALPNGRKRILYVDNCSGHNETADMLSAAHRINTEIRYFDPNLTDYVQPCDSFVIQKIKSEWAVQWERYKMEMIMRNKWTVTSGKIPNSGKRFFLELAVKSVNAVNEQRDKDGISYARKSMIMTGMAMNLNGQWEERQLMPKLQQIVNKYRNHFDGDPVD